VGFIEATNVTYKLPGARVLFEDVSFRVGHGQHVALIGANGTGKSTLLNLIAGRDASTSGTLRVDGRVGVMDQFIGVRNDGMTVKDFLLRLANADVQRVATEIKSLEAAVTSSSDDVIQNRYAHALGEWSEVGGYEMEVLWDTCTTAALGRPFDEVAYRWLHTLSGGEQKRLALQSLFRADYDVLLLDEPDNFLDIPGKRWLEDTLNGSRKTILFVSHDRALLANTATRLVTLEGRGAWTHPNSFSTYNEARRRRIERIEEERRRYKEEHERLIASMKELKRRAAISDALASRAKASVTKLERFERTVVQPQRPAEQNIRLKLGGGRTGKLALRIDDLAFPDLVKPFSTEIFFGERVGVVGANGTGKSHFLRLLSGEQIGHTGQWRLGARVEPSLFSQLHDRPELGNRSIVELLTHRGFELGAAMSSLKRYELHPVAHLPFSLLSGGQQARFQLLLMEKESPTMLLLDEPTDNLDVESAEALEEGLMNYEGTVVAATHDRWFMLLLDRFLIFRSDGSVHESLESPYL
jgi:ATPase subunit of ABC transporter with duplicated ATPase domains